ncbi:DUF4160 domain-containing protein [Geomonas paludis]|uniref:DUF4160 domain-containing protein n=2 Tax=Geomonas paludis TaxID=2740185 RepID=A0A6V8MWJ2_9BACT|nr:DUF4160 domain-containing protein [Geomonas paludis]GFO64441.1 hypothetical protein GMPD_23600 [Geomonas paludis]
MPIISMFFGVIVYMFSHEEKGPSPPHVHAAYGDDYAIFSIQDGVLLEGKLPENKQILVQAWIEIHKEDLQADWCLAVSGQTPLPIKPLD